MAVFAGAAGRCAFENGIPGGLNRYGEARWWTAMVMTTMGSQDWPQTVEGVAGLLSGAAGFSRLRHVTAAVATFFVGRDAENGEAEPAGAKQLTALLEEAMALRNDLRALSRRPP